MSPEQQRIAIAEACGLKQHEEQIEHTDGYQWTETRHFWVCPKGKRVTVPDYLTDLNAMHEAEKVLTREQADAYIFELHELIGHNHIERYAVSATAAQRAEAFLRTLNLWKE